MYESKNITTYRQSLKERILHTAMKLFAKHGVKAVKMDDIAQQLGISKRTLYEIYENKELLLFEGVKTYKQQKDQEILQWVKQSDNVMDFFLHFYRMEVEDLRSTNPQLFSDISKYPAIVDYLQAKKEEHRQLFHQLTQRGVSEGFFRDNIDYALVSHMVDAMSSYMASNNLYQQFSIVELFHNSVLTYLRGLCTVKGIVAIDESLR